MLRFNFNKITNLSVLAALFIQCACPTKRDAASNCIISLLPIKQFVNYAGLTFFIPNAWFGLGGIKVD